MAARKRTPAVAENDAAERVITTGDAERPVSLGVVLALFGLGWGLIGGGVWYVHEKISALRDTVAAQDTNIAVTKKDLEHAKTALESLEKDFKAAVTPVQPVSLPTKPTPK